MSEKRTMDCTACGDRMTLHEEPRQLILGPLHLLWFGWPQKRVPHCVSCESNQQQEVIDQVAREAYDEGAEAALTYTT